MRPAPVRLRHILCQDRHVSDWIGEQGDLVAATIVDVDFALRTGSELIGHRILAAEQHELSVATYGETAKSLAALTHAERDVIGIRQDRRYASEAVVQEDITSQSVIV